MWQSLMASRVRHSIAVTLLVVLSLWALLVGPLPRWVHVITLALCVLSWVGWREKSEAPPTQETIHPETAPEPSPSLPMVADGNHLTAHTARLDQLVSACVAKMEAATELARRSGGRVAQGASTMLELKAAVAEMDRHLGVSSQAFDDLQQRAARIGALVETVKEIARQTNLLAINAAIEAARAGPLGKGFGVVAGEVKLLAGRADSAAMEIGKLAEALSSACAGAQAQVEQMKQVSARGITHSSAVQEVFSDIQNGAAQRVKTVAEVFADMREQQAVLGVMRRES